MARALRLPAAPSSLRALIGWTLLGNAVYAACQWGALVVLTKLGTPRMVGQYSLGVAIAAPILMFSNLQLRAIQASDVASRHAFSDYWFLRLVTTTIALGAISACALIPSHAAETALVLLAVGLAKCVESFSDVIYGHLQRRERMERIALSLVMKGLVSVLAFILALILFKSVVACAVGLFVAWSLVLVGYDLRQVRSDLSEFRLLRWSEVKNRHRVRDIVIAGVPMGLALMCLSLANTIPRYFVESTLGVTALGYYSAILYPTTLFPLLTSAVGQAATPRLADLAGRDASAYWRLLGRLGLLVLGPVVISLLVARVFGREILTILYRPDYADYSDLFFLVFLAAGVWTLASVLGYGATAARVFSAQAPIAALIAVATLISCAVLVPRYGLFGAAWANVLGGIIACATYGIILVLNLRSRRYAPVIQSDEPTSALG